MSIRPARPERPVERISGPDELVQAVPYLLGFHPHDSMVLVGLADGRLVVTARLDLGDAFHGAVEHTIAAIHRGGARALVAVLYPAGDADRAAATDVARLADLVNQAATAGGCTVDDVLCVAGGRWRSLTCSVAECCPPRGRALPAGPSAFAAAATVAGVVALSDRESLARQLDPLYGPGDVDRLRRLIASAEQAGLDVQARDGAARATRALKRSMFTTARAMDEPGTALTDAARVGAGVGAARLDDETVARFGAALREPAIRDAAWTAIDDRRLDGRVLWRELASRLPAPYDAAPFFLFGWATWRSGDGALAGMAADRAVASDPTYSAADMLLAVLAHGVDPHTLPPMRLPKLAKLSDLSEPA